MHRQVKRQGQICGGCQNNAHHSEDKGEDEDKEDENKGVKFAATACVCDGQLPTHLPVWQIDPSAIKSDHGAACMEYRSTTCWLKQRSMPGWRAMRIRVKRWRSCLCVKVEVDWGYK